MTCVLAEAPYPAVSVLFSLPTLTGVVQRYKQSTFFGNIEGENHTNKLNMVNESVKGGSSSNGISEMWDSSLFSVFLDLLEGERVISAELNLLKRFFFHRELS